MAGWTSLVNPPPAGVSTAVLLTDGRVLCRGDDGTSAGGKRWFVLAPASNGDYTSGTWTEAAPSNHARRYYSSAVLSSGAVLVAGGEESDAGADLNAAELYDPLTNRWIPLSTPPGWSAIGDAPNCVLADGRLLLGSILTTETAIFNPADLSWSAGPTKDDRSDEETWTLLPDGSVVTVECDHHPAAERYVPAQNRWVSAGKLPVDLVQGSSSEIGPAILLPTGKVFALGATGHTAFYLRPSDPMGAGMWVAGPDFPNDQNGVQLIAKDAPAALLPTGHVLCAVSPFAEGTGPKSYPGPSYFFEFDGVRFNLLPSPRGAANPAYVFRFLLLPTGEALVTCGTDQVDVYKADGLPDQSWAPSLASVPAPIAPGGTFRLSGTQLNGLSQGASYGDDATMATNYPLVRIRPAGQDAVIYCRTHDHDSMGVATGSKNVSTNFDVPATTPIGPATLEVVANGIASSVRQIAVAPTAPNTGPTRARGCLPQTTLVLAAAAVAILLATILR